MLVLALYAWLYCVGGRRRKPQSGCDLCAQGETYVIDEGVEVVATPGHTYTDVSLVVRNTTIGTVLLAGKFNQYLIKVIAVLCKYFFSCPVLVHGQVTVIFVMSVCLSVCLCRVFLSR